MGQASYIEDIADRLQDVYGDMLTLRRDLKHSDSNKRLDLAAINKLIDKTDLIIQTLRNYSDIANDPKIYLVGQNEALRQENLHLLAETERLKKLISECDCPSKEARIRKALPHNKPTQYELSNLVKRFRK